MNTSTYHFLYVEDDPNSRIVMHVMLSHVFKGSHITIYEDSYDFVSRLTALPTVPDVIFLDIQIGPLNGFAMLDMIRELPDFDHSRVIALTASVMNEEIVALKSAGFDGAIAKPLDREVFPNLMNQILAGYAVWYVS